MEIRYARIETKSCPMSDDVCLEKVAEHIANMSTRNDNGELVYTLKDGSTTSDPRALIEAFCGRYVRGKNKGKIRGWAHITVVTVGGWQRLGPGEHNGRVVYPGAILGVSIVDFNGNPYLAY